MVCELVVWRAAIGTFYTKISKCSSTHLVFMYKEHNSYVELIHVIFCTSVLTLVLTMLQSAYPKYNIAFVLIVIYFFLIECNSDFINPGPTSNTDLEVNPQNTSSSVYGDKHVSIAKY